MWSLERRIRENFPVGSVLLPGDMRDVAHVIYRFARTADDIVDEGNATVHQRYAALGEFRRGLEQIRKGDPIQPANPLLADLSRVIALYDLDVRLFEEMLVSFEQDIEFKGHPDFDSLLQYAGGAANSFGRLMLKVCHADTPENIDYSDAICTSLLMADFLHDVAVDWTKGRVYFPATHMQEFGITPRDIEAGIVDDRWRALMRYEIGIARQMMFYGAPLAYRMKGRFRPELCIIIQAGLRSLDQIERGDYDVFRQKPMLRPSDWLVIFYRSIGMFRGKPIRDEAVGVRHGSCHPATHINR